VTKFNNLLLAGMKAQLVMECEEGCARVKLEVILRQHAANDVNFELGKGRQVEMQLSKV
jgi:hypothetical protein